METVEEKNEEVNHDEESSEEHAAEQEHGGGGSVHERTLWQRFSGMEFWHKCVIFVGIFLFFLLLIYKIFFQANFSRTVYVDATVRTSGNGSFARPIKDLQTAIDQYTIINPGAAFDIEISGKHEGDFILPELTQMRGHDGAATTIVGSVTVGREAILSDFRVTGSGPGVVVPDGRTAVLERLDISDNEGNGVDTGEEVGMKITTSRVSNNAGEGISVSARSHVEIIDTEVKKNAKEGIDFEYGVKGTLTNNTITDNMQSGVEYVLGESIGVLRGNIIERNGSSGVTVQFSADHPLLGNIQVVDNTISNNQEFGIECEKPGKGDRPERYYDNSTSFEFNEVRGNQNDPIAKKCGFKL